MFFATQAPVLGFFSLHFGLDQIAFSQNVFSLLYSLLLCLQTDCKFMFFLLFLNNQILFSLFYQDALGFVTTVP